MTFKEFIELAEEQLLEDVKSKVKGKLKSLYIHCIKIIRYNRREDFIKHVKDINEFEKSAKETFLKKYKFEDVELFKNFAEEVEDLKSFNKWVSTELSDYENKKHLILNISKVPDHKEAVSNLFKLLTDTLDNEKVFSSSDIQEIAKYYNIHYNESDQKFEDLTKIKRHKRK